MSLLLQLLILYDLIVQEADTVSSLGQSYVELSEGRENISLFLLKLASRIVRAIVFMSVLFK